VWFPPSSLAPHVVLLPGSTHPRPLPAPSPYGYAGSNAKFGPGVAPRRNRVLPVHRFPSLRHPCIEARFRAARTEDRRSTNERHQYRPSCAVREDAAGRKTFSLRFGFLCLLSARATRSGIRQILRLGVHGSLAHVSPRGHGRIEPETEPRIKPRIRSGVGASIGFETGLAADRPA